MAEPEFPAPAEGMVATMLFIVADPESTRDFYRDVLGAQVTLERDPGGRGDERPLSSPSYPRRTRPPTPPKGALVSWPRMPNRRPATIARTHPPASSRRSGR